MKSKFSLCIYRDYLIAFIGKRTTKSQLSLKSLTSCLMQKILYVVAYIPFKTAHEVEYSFHLGGT